MRYFFCLGILLFSLLFMQVASSFVGACSICSGFSQSLTFREEAARPQAKVIFLAKVANSTLSKDGKGFSLLSIEKLFRKPMALELGKTVRLAQYIPVAETGDAFLLIFADVRDGQVEPYRGVSLKGRQAEGYLSAMFDASPLDPVLRLEKVMPFLESPVREVASDAFLEFAKANDETLARVSKKMDATHLRTWILDARVPEERLGLYAYLLGGCGGAGDIDFLMGILRDQGRRSAAAYDGAMIALLRLQPERTWPVVYGLLENQDTSLQLRLACFRSLKAMLLIAESPTDREKIYKAYRVAWQQGELADLSVEELRRTSKWEWTDEILVRYGTKGYEAPVVKRAILRYALTAPQTPTLQKFLDQRKQSEPMVLEEVRESLGLVPVGK